MLRQKARFKWAIKGDESTKFFYPSVKQRLHHNIIDYDGNMSSQPKDIENEVVFLSRLSRNNYFSTFSN